MEKQQNQFKEGLYRKKLSKTKKIYRTKLTSWRSIYLRDIFTNHANSIFQDNLSYNIYYDNHQKSYNICSVNQLVTAIKRPSPIEVGGTINIQKTS